MTVARSVLLSELLSRAAGRTVHLVDRERLAAECRRSDQPLYTAYRDVHRRQVTNVANPPTTWRGDRVHYAGGLLPTGEPVRSVGHWNPPGQIEVFQVLAGRVVILVARPDEPDHLSIAEYREGEMCVVPLNAFHLTYSPWQDSVVYNIYSSGGGWPPPDHTRKYDGEAAPPHTLIFTAGQARAEQATVTPEPAQVDRVPLTADGLDLPARLPSLLVDASDEQLRELAATFNTAPAVDRA
ncbi:hypothetical protein GCM10029976_087560 [Kribbella albertanoniae]|uniref:hypothetical protein n=1 Tax=Kribbella albertanoniae TaxID=1266829 RepID=UPI0014053D63|nr:hypothetical protein [Kribbella albertanoniae]